MPRLERGNGDWVIAFIRPAPQRLDDPRHGALGLLKPRQFRLRVVASPETNDRIWTGDAAEMTQQIVGPGPQRRHRGPDRNGFSASRDERRVVHPRFRLLHKGAIRRLRPACRAGRPLLLWAHENLEPGIARNDLGDGREPLTGEAVRCEPSMKGRFLLSPTDKDVPQMKPIGLAGLQGRQATSDILRVADLDGAVVSALDEVDGHQAAPCIAGAVGRGPRRIFSRGAGLCAAKSASVSGTPLRPANSTTAVQERDGMPSSIHRQTRDGLFPTAAASSR